MQDRFADLQALAESLGNVSSHTSFVSEDPDHQQAGLFGSHSKIFVDLRNLDILLKKFESDINTLKSEADSFCVASDSTKNGHLLSTLHAKTARRIERDITIIQKKIDKIELVSTKLGSSTKQRIVVNKTAFIRNHFMQLLQEYFKVDCLIRDKLKESFKYKLATVEPNLDIRNLERLDNIDSAMQQAGTLELAGIDTKGLLDQLSTEAAMLDQLNKNLGELCRLFKELAVLVQCQGETIESIERSLDRTGAKVHEGVKQLKLARKYKGHQRVKALIVTLISFFVGATTATAIALKLGLADRKSVV